MKKFIQNYGAQYIVTLRGNAQAIQQTVNLFCNFKLMVEPPSTFKEGEDEEVILKCTQRAFHAGLQAIAEFQIQNNPSRRKLIRDSAHFRQIAAAMADAEFNTFKRVNLATTGERDGAMHRYELEEHERTPELKRAARKILGALRRNTTTAASKAGNN